MKIWAYGDSFVAGDQDDPARIDALPEIMEYNRYNISFASVLANRLNVKLINRGISGCSNLVQLDKLFKDAPNIDPKDIVIFVLTSSLRDRFQIPLHYKEFVKDSRGPTLGDRTLFKSSNMYEIPTADIFYVLSTIEKIENLHNIKIVKINAFHNFMDNCPNEERYKFQFKNFLGLHSKNNTILDILSDNWLSDNHNKTEDHNKWTPPVEYQKYFTKKSHPSVEGHKKLSDWFYKELKNVYHYS